jgi:hypothetical protein
MIGGLIYLYFAAVGDHVDKDGIFCPTTGAKSQTLILVDASDTIGDLTRTEITQRLSDLAAATPTGGRLTIRTLRSDSHGTDQIFDLCNPGDGSDLSYIIANPDLAKRKWQSGFEGPLSMALKQATNDNQSKTSPLMGAIQQYAVERLVSKAAQGIPTKLILISDMFENTPDFSMYRQGADFAAFMHSPAATTYDTDLHGADVELWLITRSKPPADPNGLTLFWNQWIARADGSLARVSKLQGVSDG